ncbi:hypothetical protein Vafri_16458, partial [Volvox africanus]
SQRQQDTSALHLVARAPTSQHVQYRHNGGISSTAAGNGGSGVARGTMAKVLVQLLRQQVLGAALLAVLTSLSGGRQKSVQPGQYCRTENTSGIVAVAVNTSWL